MRSDRRHARVGVAAACAVFFAAVCPADGTAERGADPATAAALVRIRSAAVASDWAFTQLEHLTDEIGPRLSGSPGQAAAITRVAAAMRSLGARVTLQPAKVPHWVRGEERAELTEYPGRPPGVTQRLQLTALGGSGATAASGLAARVIVVRDFEELKARAAEIPGNIVLFESRFDQRLADNGRAMTAYVQAGEYRFRGPAEAAALGAAAALVRSIGGADYRLPHTGATVWKDQQRAIPAAAGVIQVLQQVNLHPRRTIRFIGWTNEENGGRGGKAYVDSIGGDFAAQCAAIESDAGAGRALGIEAAIPPDSLPLLQPVSAALAPLGATALELHDGEVGSDIAKLQAAGVPGFAPLVDGRHYFDYHHTAADTFDKVDPANLQSQVATMAVLAYFLAERSDCLPRVPVGQHR